MDLLPFQNFNFRDSIIKIIFNVKNIRRLKCIIATYDILNRKIIDLKFIKKNLLLQVSKS